MPQVQQLCCVAPFVSKLPPANNASKSVVVQPLCRKRPAASSNSTALDIPGCLRLHAYPARLAARRAADTIAKPVGLDTTFNASKTLEPKWPRTGTSLCFSPRRPQGNCCERNDVGTPHSTKNQYTPPPTHPRDQMVTMGATCATICFFLQHLFVVEFGSFSPKFSMIVWVVHANIMSSFLLTSSTPSF